jgi:hypothetical protein
MLVYSCFAHGLQKYFRELGIKTTAIADNKLEELFQLSLRMFDTRLPPGVTVMSPFADDSSLTKIGVEVCTLKIQTCEQYPICYFNKSCIIVHPFICITYTHMCFIFFYLFAYLIIICFLK